MGAADRLRLARVDEIPPEGILFTYRDGPFENTGLLVMSSGGVRAWRNVCRHLAVRLDRLHPGEFMTQDRRFLLCQEHGARYRLDDGYCASGPCEGSSLRPLPIVVLGNEVFLDTSDLGGWFSGGSTPS